MSEPDFSIATPVRNAIDKLKRCVGSVRGQRDVWLEHLIQDACSEDGTPAWLSKQQAGDDRILPVSEFDSGMYDAINRAWHRSRGRYLSWLNADEQYLPGTLALVRSIFETHPDADAVFGDYLVVDPEGHAVALRREIPLRRFYVANTFLNAQSCTLFFRRGLLERGLLDFDQAFRYAADKDLVLRLLSARIRILHIPAVLSLFGVDGQNLSTHPGMAREAEMVRLRHGGFRWRALRQLASIGRRLERMHRGAYRRSTLVYCYALDETPRYATFSAASVGGRYSLDNFQGSAVLINEDASA